MARSYNQPRRLNTVSLTLLLLLAAGGYWFYVFFPVYWDAWTVDHELIEGASESYRLNRLSEPERTKQLRAMLQRVKEKCIKLGHVTDPDFDVTMDIDGDNVVMHGEYSVTVKHPVGNYTSVIHLKRAEKANIKQVVWE